MFDLGLKQKALISILGIFTLFSLLFTAIYIPFQNQISDYILDRNKLLIQTLIERDKDPIANEIFDHSDTSIKIRLKDMLRVDGVLLISVHDKKGEIIAFEGPTTSPDELTIPTRVLTSGGTDSNISQWQDHTVLQYFYEIKAIGERMGFIQVYFLLDDMMRYKQYSFIFLMVFLASILLTLGSAGNYLLSKMVTEPIITLRDLMLKIQAGDFKQRMDIHRADEFGELASSFNEMANNLDASYSEIKQKTDQIRSMRSYLKNIIDSMSSMVISVDQDAKITALNQAALNFMGMDEQEGIGKNICSFIPLFEQYRSNVQDVIQTGTPLELYQQKLAENPEKLYAIFISPLTADAQGAVIRIDDVSELHEKDEQLKQAQKMETIGTLAGGIAHDFNNILSGIVGTASLLKYTMESGKLDDKTLNKSIDTIEISSRRASELVKQLLALSRKQEMSIGKIDLNESIRHVVNICRNSFDKSIEIREIYEHELAMSNADSSQIEQVLLNICINASHAMTIMHRDHNDWGGILSLSVTSFLPDKLFCERHSNAVEGNYWRITVVDSGVGMDDTTIKKIFDPFYTTKEYGLGTGLGLSIVYSTIRQHNGIVEVSSKPGNGTTFSIYLLSAEREDGSNATDVQSEATGLTFGSGTILVIDDEAIVRNMAELILRQAGYTVLLAKDGEEGLQLFREKSSEISAVLLDLVMPKMHGHEVYRHLKEQDPEVKVLMVSGFIHDERARKALSMGVQGFLQKPYTLASLTDAIDTLLHS